MLIVLLQCATLNVGRGIKIKKKIFYSMWKWADKAKKAYVYNLSGTADANIFTSDNRRTCVFILNPNVFV